MWDLNSMFVFRIFRDKS